MDATRSWLLLLCLAAAGVLQARAQPDSIGFINIDCGLPGTESFVDEATGLSYSPDDAFIDTGSNNNISTEYVTPEIDRGFHNLRSFPDGARNCYTLRSLVAGLKYTIRTYFMYGNYDGLNKPPVFDVHIGVNFWRTVNASNPGIVWTEATVVVPNDFVQVCLVNTGSGTPFISGLELRPLNRKLYPQVNATQGLVLLDRVNFGPTNGTAIIRYPDDPHDRLWIPLVDTINWAEISTNETVRNINNDLFEAPSKVMQTAIKPRNSSQDIELSWSEPMLPPNKDPSPGYIIVMHFSELQELHGAARQFYINLNSMYLDVFTTTLLYSEAVYSTIPFQRGYTKYTLSLNATENSTLPPIINALEIFSVIPTSDVGTDPLDGSTKKIVKPQDESTKDGHLLSALQHKNRQFTYSELKTITKNFNNLVGKGGFGKVYDGVLEDDTRVAVKLRPQSPKESDQAEKQFIAEVACFLC
ncbi:hypothetical protein QOZ80_5BG0413730 [Eleusine coracana subsp. coracana]|nr:hypothetical protein QOZ80_5BG0413730 [Eleusine coracana subsp. coracana]